MILKCYHFVVFCIFTTITLIPREVWGSEQSEEKASSLEEKKSDKKRERSKKTKEKESENSSDEEKSKSKKPKLAETIKLDDVPQNPQAVVEYFNAAERKEILEEIAQILYEKYQNNTEFEAKFNTHTHDAFKVWIGEDKPQSINAKAKQKILKLKKLYLFSPEINFAKAKAYGDQIVKASNSKFQLQLEGQQGFGLDVVGDAVDIVGYYYNSKEAIEERKQKKDEIIKNREKLTDITVRFNVDKIIRAMMSNKEFSKNMIEGTLLSIFPNK